MNVITESFTEPLGAGDLQSSQQTLCAPGMSMQYEVKSVFLENLSGADRVIDLKFYIKGQVKNWITNMTLLANCKIDLLGSVPVGLKFGDEIRGSCDVNGAVKYSIFGRVQIQ